MYYHVSGTPNVVIDGLLKIVGAASCTSSFGSYNECFNIRSAKPSPMTITPVFLDATTLDVGLTNLSNSPLPGRLFVAIVERHIPFNWYREKEVDNVFRSMAPTSGGVSLTLAAGQSLSQRVTLDISPFWTIRNCQVVVFFQGNDAEIKQAATEPLPLPDNLVTPASGKMYPTATPLTVQWDPRDFSGALNLWYAAGSGEAWLPIATGVPNSGSCVWPSPPAEPGLYRVKVSSEDGKRSVKNASPFSLVHRGDFNHDGAVNALDLQLLSQTLAAGLPWTEDWDLNGDGRVDSTEQVITAVQSLP